MKSQLGHLETKMTAARTRRDIEDCFGKWGIEEYRIRSSRRDGRETTTAEIIFYVNDKPQTLTCHRFLNYETNLRALYLILESLRKASERGILEEFARAALAMLPQGRIQRPPHEVLGLARNAPMTVAQAAYKALAKERHPDAGGSDKAMQELNEAWEAYQAANGV